MSSSRPGGSGVVGGVAHGGDDDAHGVAVLARLDDAVGDPLDAVGVGHGGAAVLLHDQAHCELLPHGDDGTSSLSAAQCQFGTRRSVRCRLRDRIRRR
jgi:hypothetical protein